jgi:hypothetical protein
MEKLPKVLISKNEEKRNIQLEYLRQQQLQHIKNKSEEQRDMYVQDM